MESSDEEDDDSGSDGARNNEDAEVLKLRREEEEEREEKHNREKLGRTVFVGNVPVETDRKELQKLFKAYGEVESVRLRSVALAKESLLSYRKVRTCAPQFVGVGPQGLCEASREASETDSDATPRTPS